MKRIIVYIILLILGVLGIPMLIKYLKTRAVLSDVSEYKENSYTFDSKKAALQLNEIIGRGFVRWFGEDKEVINIINSIPDRDVFNEVVRYYAKDFKKDLHKELIDFMSDGGYRKLKYN